MIARAFGLFSALSFALVVTACGGSEASGSGGNALSAGQAKVAGDGIGATLGGCPEAEQADGAACEVQGRLCEWKRSDGALATGWCTKAGSWRVVVGPSAPCPEKAATRQLAQGEGAPSGGPSGGTPEPAPEPVCSAGLSCTYPSTPLDGSRICSCEADGQWNSLCSGNDDGWKEKAGVSGGGDSSCGELAACGGRSGCGTACYGTVSPGPNGTTNVAPGQTTKSCGCGEDGFMYCAIKPCGG